MTGVLRRKDSEMAVPLNPRTLYKLKAFAHRRRRLIKIRGVCSFVFTVLAAMTVVAIVDFLVVLPDTARLVLSVGAYILAAAVFCLTCLRLLVREPALTELARMFEAGHGELKEEVLSAVELGKVNPGPVKDSESLRQLIQEQVASLVRPYQPGKMLPIRTLRRWIAATLAVIVLCIALSLVPGLRFPKLMARALVPTANIARVSKLQITVIEPARSDFVVPRGDPVTVVVQLSQATDDDVILESRVDDDDGSSNVIRMEPAGGRRYSSILVVAEKDLKYRVLSGKASTRFYTIRSQRRPHVTMFHKVYRYPAYSGLEDEAITERSGDLRALQDTKVELKMEVDQPVKSAELWIDTGSDREVKTVNVADTQLLNCNLQLSESGTYRVHVIASDTGFDNKFAPNYELTALGDLVPGVRITAPDEDRILPADALVRLTGTADDDLGLEEVRQLYRINQGLWKQKVLGSDCGKKYDVRTNWDLLDLDLSPGDVVATKLEATDLKGNVGESITVQITVSTADFATDQTALLELRKAVHDAVEEFHSAARQMRENLKTLQEQVQNNPRDRQKHRQFIKSVRRNADTVEAAGQKAWENLLSAVSREESVDLMDDLMVAGRIISELRHRTLGRTHQLLEGLEQKEQIEKGNVDKVMSASGPLDWRTNQLIRAQEDMLAEAYAAVASDETVRLIENQASMLEHAIAAGESKDETLREAAWIRLGREQQAASREQQQLDQMLLELQNTSDYHRRKQATEILKNLSKDRDAMDELLKTGKPGPEALVKCSQNRRKVLEEAYEKLLSMHEKVTSRASRNRQNLAKSVGMTADDVARLRSAVDNGANQQASFLKMQDQANVEQERLEKQRQRTAEAAADAEYYWTSARGQLKDVAYMHDSRSRADYDFIADTHNALAAIEALYAVATDPESAKEAARAISQIEQAYRTLEAGHWAVAQRDFIRDVAWRERWNPEEIRRLDHPLRHWENWEAAVTSSPRMFQRAGFEKDVSEGMRKLVDQKEARAIDREAQNRRSHREEPSVVARQADALAQQMSEVMDLMQPRMEEARRLIAEYAPSVAEQLHAASDMADEIRADTESLAENSEQVGLEKARTQTDQVLGEQMQLNDKLDAVRNALRRDANRQDLTVEKARERARDADDALAMLQQPPVKAQQALSEAASAAEPAEQGEALDAALEQQGKLSETLDLLARHYENLEAGQPEQTRAQLRAVEQENAAAYGIDNSYDEANRLAELSQMPVEQLKPILEQELTQNEVMQQELGRIVDRTLDEAAGNLEQMVQQEQQISEQLEKIADRQASNDSELRDYSEKMGKLEARAKELAQRAEQLASADIPRLAEQAKQVTHSAERHLTVAREAASDAAKQMPQEFSGSPTALAQQVDEFASMMDAADEDIEAAGQKTAASATNKNRQQAREAARQARDANKTAQGSAQDARRLARELRDAARRSSAQLEQTDQQQAVINETAGPVSEDIRRAAEHAERLGLPQTGALAETAAAMEDISAEELPAALNSLRQSPAAEPAQAPVRQAHSEMGELLADVQQMAESSDMSESAKQPSNLQAQMAQWMARALDRLEAAELAGTQSAAQSAQAQQAVRQPLSNQQATMAQARAQSVPAPRSTNLTQYAMASQMSSDSMHTDMPPPTGQPLPEQLRLRSGDWGKLRKLEATEMLESNTEAVAEEYREMVHAYFDAISQKSINK